MHKRTLGILLSAVAALTWSSYPLIAANTATKDLYYFVIDRSGSIAEKKLVEPFRKAVVDFVGRLDPESEVNVVFFSDSASRPRGWYPMDLRAKGEFGKYFDDSFRPGGNTLLYATVADALNRVLAKESEYRNIRIVILSDGEDNKSAPKFTKWEDVEKLLPEKWAKQRKGLSVIWAAVEFEPQAEHKPSPDGIIQMLSSLDRTEIERVFTPPPRATFTANPTRVKVNDPVLFALDDDTGVTSVLWTFGDGATSAKKTDSHRYTVKGTYDVSVEATGPGGKSKVEKKGSVQVVEEVPLEAIFTWHPPLVRINDRIKFTDESLGSPTEWSWDVQGQVSQKERNPTLVFTKPGKVAVSLTASREGATHQVQQQIEVLPLAPDAGFSAEPREVEMSQAVAIKARTSEPGWAHTWTIGGDVVREGAETEWVSDRLGLVEIQHTVRGPGGIVDKAATVFVKERPEDLISRFSWTPKEIHVGDQVQFVDESAGSPKTWTWEMSGLAPNNEHNPLVTFSEPKTVTVKLTITRDGRSATSQVKSFDVLPKVVNLQAAFDAKPKKKRTPATVQFSDKSKGAVARWAWDFGDGTTSDLQSPSHEYTRAGTYRPRLTVTDAQGQSSQSPGDVLIQATGPLAWYWKSLIALAVLLIFWLVVVVPIAKTFILPHPSSRLFTTGPNRLREKALANSSIWWPVGYVRIGGSANDNIKLMITDPALQNKSLAVVQRVPLTRQYTLRAVQSVGVQVQVGTGPTATRKDVKKCDLKNGTVFYVANTQFRFELS